MAHTLLRPLCHGEGGALTAHLTKWRDAVGSARRILLIVNSQSGAESEIHQTLDAIGRDADFSRVSAIVPAAWRRTFASRGVSTRALMAYEMMEVGFALQSDRVLQWAIRQQADLVVSSEPYLPDNQEVKPGFELRVALLLGQAKFLVHSLPSDPAVTLSAEDLWRRTARAAAIDAHRSRVDKTLEHLHGEWSRDPETSAEHAQAIAARILAVEQVPPDESMRSMVDAWKWSYERFHDALRSDGGAPPAPIRVMTDPLGVLPSGGWLGGRFATIRRPAHRAAGLRQHAIGLSFRGTASEPFASVLMSRFVDLDPGDAAVAEGRVHHGGFTIGLVKGEQWASRVDVVERGRFLVAAVATKRGRYALVVAHCLPGADRRSAFTMRRVGIRRAEK
jgi:hypothetical protein